MKLLALIILLITAVLLGWQRHHLVSLQNELVVEREATEKTETTHPGAESRRGSTASNRTSGSHNAPSQQQPALEHLLALAPQEDTSPYDPEFVRALPALLKALSDTTPDELFELLEEIGPDAMESSRPQFLARVLLLLVSQAEPERTLAWLKGHPEIQSRFSGLLSTAFASLARSDPKRAHKLLTEQENLPPTAEAALLLAWARSDFQQALEFLRQRSWEGDNKSILRTLQTLARDPSLRPLLIEALKTEDHPDLRRHFTRDLAASTYFADGLSGVDELLSDLNLRSSPARDDVIRKVASWALLDRPKEATEWLLEGATSKNRAKFLASQVRVWADQDYAAAGEWLKTQEPSQENSQAYSAYAMALLTIDPATAVQWADRIANKRLKEATRRLLLDEWRRQDPIGAPK